MGHLSEVSAGELAENKQVDFCEGIEGQRSGADNPPWVMGRMR